MVDQDWLAIESINDKILIFAKPEHYTSKLSGISLTSIRDQRLGAAFGCTIILPSLLCGLKNVQRSSYLRS